MQKLVYLSNSRDYTEQGNINENKYFTHVNELLEQGWKVTNITQNVVKLENSKDPSRKESFAAFILLEKADNSEDK